MGAKAREALYLGCTCLDVPERPSPGVLRNELKCRKLGA
jgi:hypothetical protein